MPFVDENRAVLSARYLTTLDASDHRLYQAIEVHFALSLWHRDLIKPKLILTPPVEIPYGNLLTQASFFHHVL